MYIYIYTGPGNWLHVDCLAEFRWFGFLAQLRDLPAAMQASKVRVACRSDSNIEERRTDTALHTLQFDAKFGKQHPHYFGHAQAFVNNAALAKRFLHWSRAGLQGCSASSL